MDNFKRGIQSTNTLIIGLLAVCAVFLIPDLAQAKTKLLTVKLINHTSQKVEVNYCKAGTESSRFCSKGLKTSAILKESGDANGGDSINFRCRKRPFQSTKRHENCRVHAKFKGNKDRLAKTALVANGHELHVFKNDATGRIHLSPEAREKKTLSVTIKNDTNDVITVGYCKKGEGNYDFCKFGKKEIPPKTKVVAFSCDKRPGDAPVSNSNKGEYCRISIQTPPQDSEQDEKEEFVQVVKDQATVTVTATEKTTKTFSVTVD